MAYKLKPNKAMAKRVRVTKTGKIKHRHTFLSHLRSARTSKKKRHLGRPAIMFEGLARNMRKYLLVSKVKPGKIAHERALAAKKAQATAKNA